MYLVGITGMIASGKTSVAKLYKDMGAYLLDADRIGHKLLRNSSVKKRISAVFGKEVFDDKGEVSREKLANVVFNDLEKLTQLDDIMGKLITSELREKILELQEGGFPGIVVIDAALLPRWELIDAMDMIIIVDAPKWQLMNRLVRQRGFSSDEAERRIAAQEPIFKNFHPKKSIIVKNNGDNIELRANAMAAWMEIKEYAKAKK